MIQWPELGTMPPVTLLGGELHLIGHTLPKTSLFRANSNTNPDGNRQQTPQPR
jgi:hypothetical protein